MKQNFLRNALMITAFGAVVGAQAQTVAEAIALTQSERFEKAGTTLRNLLAASPTDGEAWFYLGENYFENVREDSAAYCYNKGVEVNPRQPLNYAGQGKVLWVKGQRDQAVAKFNEAIGIATDKANKFTKKLQAQTQREVAGGYASGQQRGSGEGHGCRGCRHALDATDPEAFILKGDIMWEQNPTDASQPVALYKKASDLRTTSDRKCSQLLVCLSGEIRVVCDDGRKVSHHLLDSVEHGLIVPPGIWAREDYMSDGAVMMVLCDRVYEEEDYIRDYDEFKAITRS